MTNMLICEHGNLRRQCELCERDDRIAELKQQRDNLLEAIKNLMAVKGRHHAEIAYNRLVEVLAEVEAKK